MKEKIKKILKNLPSSSGVYQMKDKGGNIIYIGKAKSLKKRVPSYFQKNRELAPFTKKLVENIENIDYVETNSEIEALILESNLIKEHQPKYNIVMRDDKSFLYIKITKNEDFPKISTVRYPEMKSDKNAKYFGPKTSAEKTREILKLLKKLFPYRHCGLDIKYLDQNKTKIKNKIINYPCIDYHINRCPAPCIGAISPIEYKKIVQRIENFLEGKHQNILKELKNEMADAVKEKKFEKAAVIRDKIIAIENITQKQQISQPADFSQDVINFIIKNDKIFFNLFIIREGELIDQENFCADATGSEALLSRILKSFIAQYYKDATDLPKEIIVPEIPEDKDLLEKWLNIKIIIPEKGNKEKILKLSLKNAESFASQSLAKWEKIKELKNEFEDLKKILKTKTRINRIECYDISHLSGENTVGSMVVFENGQAKKNDYRHFKIQSTKGEIDDYKSMEEILTRRFQKLSELPKNYKIQKIKKSEYDIVKKTREQTENKDLNKFYTLKEGDKIIGIVGLKEIGGNVYEAIGLWIDENYRGKKLGYYLIQYVLKKCPENKMYVTCKQELSDYYQKIGFKPIKKIPKPLEKSIKVCKKIHCSGVIEAFVIYKKDIQESFNKKPDLVILDGGKGQLQAGIKVLKNLNLEIPIIALAKREEEIFIPGSSAPLGISRNKELSKFFQQIRDEAHRFALNYNKLMRGKDLFN